MSVGGSDRVGFVEMVKRANAPPPAEHSVVFRLATLVAVLVGVLACARVGEITSLTALVASAAIAAGMLFSYATRRRPHGMVKVLLALAVVGVFVAFVLQVFSAAHTGELSSILVPLAGLFTWVQVVHSFDVPARRDLLFSIAAAAALVTVAAAQAVSPSFLVYVAVWFVATVIGLACSWRSMAGGRGALPAVGLVTVSLLVVVVAVLLDSVLPAPRASQSISLPNSVSSYLPLPPGGGLTQGGSGLTEPAQAGNSSGPVRIGGFLGFAGPLNLGIRTALSNQVVLRVRADRPGYFLGMTYDHWGGQSWTNRSHCLQRTLQTGSPFLVGAGTGGGSANVQTFYVATALPNLLFGTSDPTTVYFPAHSLILGCGNSIRSTIAMTPGTVYTVISQDTEEPSTVLLRDHASPLLAPAELRAVDLQLPHPYPRVAALARSVVARAHAGSSIAATVLALEGWIARNTRYSTDIPPLTPGQDAVEEFLFGSRIGYCEQISTALTVMLRTLGIPAREATGYVPGSFDPLSNLYQIKASDAHAWVQAYIPGYGWQSFDPTADVPLAPADPGAVLLGDIGHQLQRLPWVPIGAVAAAAGATFGAREVSRRRRRPARWEAQVALRFERAGRRAGVERRPDETLAEFGGRLLREAAIVPDDAAEARRLVDRLVREVTDAAYGPGGGAVGSLGAPGSESAAEEALLGDLGRLERLLKRAGRTAPRRSSPRGRATAGRR